MHPHTHKQSQHSCVWPWSTTWLNNYIPSRQTLSPHPSDPIHLNMSCHTIRSDWFKIWGNTACTLFRQTIHMHISVGWITADSGTKCSLPVRFMITQVPLLFFLFLIHTSWDFRSGIKINSHIYLQILTNTNLSPTHTSWCDTMTPASPPTMSPLHSRPTVTRPSMGSNILRGQGSRDEVMMSLWLLVGG